MGLVKSGAGTLTLAAASPNFGGPISWAGATNPGAIVFAVAGAQGTSTSTLAVPAGGGVNFAASGTLNAGQNVTVAGFGVLSVASAAVANDITGTGVPLAVGSNLTLSPNAIIAPGSLTGFSSGTFLGGLGTTQYYFGVGGSLDGGGTAPPIAIGAGSPFLGIANDQANRDIRGVTVTAGSNFSILSATGTTLIFGSTTPANIILPAGGTTRKVVTLNAATTPPGFAGTIRFDATAPDFSGVSSFDLVAGQLDLRGASPLGNGATVADNPSVTVRSGATFNGSGAATATTITSLNANVTIAPGAILQLDDARNLNYAGAGPLPVVTQSAGSITNISNNGATALSGNVSAGTVAGSIVRMSTDGIVGLGAGGVNGTSPAAIYVVNAGNRVQTAANTSITLDGGVLTQDNAGRSLTLATGATPTTINVGAGGATIASTTAQAFTLNGLSLTGAAGGSAVTIGSTATLDGLAKLGNVTFATTAPVFTNVSGFTVAAGTLGLSAANALGSNTTTAASNPAVTVLSGATLDPGVGGGTYTNSLNANVTLAAGGRLLLNDGNNLLTSIGTVTQQAGSITEITNATALTGTAPFVTQTGALVRLSADNVTSLQATTPTQKIGANATFIATGGNRIQSSGLTLDGGGLTNDATSRSFFVAAGTTIGNFTIGAGGATVSATTGTTLTLGSATAGTNSPFAVAGGTNTLTVGSVANIDGLAKAGTVAFGSNPNGASTTVPFTVGAINVVAGGFTFLGGGGAAFNVGGGPGPITVPDGTFFQTQSGATVNGRLILSGTGQARVTTLNNPGAGFSSIEGGGSISLNNTGATLAAPVILNTGFNNLSTTYAGTIAEGTTGPGALGKAGTGTLTLTGANTYTAGTTVGNGVLLANTPGPTNSATGTGPVTVSGGATVGGALGGSGRVGGSVTVTGGAVPGRVTGGDFGTTATAVGTLSVGGSLTAAAGAGIQFDVATAGAGGPTTSPIANGFSSANGAVADRLAVTGALSLNSPAVAVNGLAGAGFQSDTRYSYLLATFAPGQGTLTGTPTFTTAGFASAAGTLSLVLDNPGGALYLQFDTQPVPEPGCVLLACAGLAAAVRLRAGRKASRAGV